MCNGIRDAVDDVADAVGMVGDLVDVDVVDAAKGAWGGGKVYVVS